jgi:hypothetical protein
MTKLEILRITVLTSELLAFCIGLSKYKVLKPIWRKFCIILGISFFIDSFSMALLFSENLTFLKNFQEYVLIHFTYLSFFWLFGQLISLNRKQQFFWIVSLIYILGWIIDIFFVQKEIYYWHSFSDSIGNLFLLIFSITYFLQLIKSEQILFFYELPSFWFSLGILIFYLFTFPFFGMFNYLANNYRNIHFVYFHIVLILSIMTNLLFAASFIWGKER